MSKSKDTELIETFINPTFLEAIKQPVNSIKISSSVSFNMNRKGRSFNVTLYKGEEGQVNISNRTKEGHLASTIIQDYCQTLLDFQKMIKNLDDMIDRLPKYS